MTVSPEPPALGHIEKSLADAYRKEIDQEENIWRSLPFFAATLALQLAAIFQLADRLPPNSSWAGWIAIGLLSFAALASLVALSFLAACIYPRKFLYLAPDPELLDYAKSLIKDEQAATEHAQAIPFSALITLKEALALQYAVGSQHNRQINKKREKQRSIAGLATLASVILTLFLVGTTFIRYTIVPNVEGVGVVKTVEPRPAPAFNAHQHDQNSEHNRRIRDGSYQPLDEGRGRPEHEAGTSNAGRD